MKIKFIYEDKNFQIQWTILWFLHIKNTTVFTVNTVFTVLFEIILSSCLKAKKAECPK